jgi:hypothetical protein
MKISNPFKKVKQVAENKIITKGADVIQRKVFEYGELFSNNFAKLKDIYKTTSNKMKDDNLKALYDDTINKIKNNETVKKIIDYFQIESKDEIIEEKEEVEPIEIEEHEIEEEELPEYSGPKSMKGD